MKSWLRIHRYLGAFCAPMLILFAISGSWQMLNYHKAKKDGSYKPPAAVKFTSDRLRGARVPSRATVRVCVPTVASTVRLIACGRASSVGRNSR